MLLHGGRSEESIRVFFQDVYELYVKVRIAGDHNAVLLSSSSSHVNPISSP